MRRPKKCSMIVMLGIVVDTYLDMLPRRRYFALVNFGLLFFEIASSQSKVVMHARFMTVKSTNRQCQCIMLSLLENLRNGVSLS